MTIGEEESFRIPEQLWINLYHFSMSSAGGDASHGAEGGADANRIGFTLRST